MSRKLNDLSPEMRPLAMQLLARCVEAGIMVIVVDTLRTKEEQAEYVRRGVSWTSNSKHLTGDAIDVAPYEVWLANGPDKIAWDSNNPAWQKIGAIGEAIGLKWGGRWTVRDLGHFERMIDQRPDDERRA